MLRFLERIPEFYLMAAEDMDLEVSKPSLPNIISSYLI